MHVWNLDLKLQRDLRNWPRDLLKKGSQQKNGAPFKNCPRKAVEGEPEKFEVMGPTLGINFSRGDIKNT